MCRKLLSRDHKIILSALFFPPYFSSRHCLLWDGNRVCMKKNLRENVLEMHCDSFGVQITGVAQRTA